MKKCAILIPHFLSPEWVAISVNAFKTFGIPVESELIVINNSPDSESIKSITETRLGEGVKVMDGRRDFPSHAYAYKLGYDSTDADWIFTAESDSYPTRHGFFDEYIKASVNHHLIGPEMPMASGTFIHPAGSLVSRKLLEDHKEWASSISDWRFCPGAAPMLGLSDRGYHVVAKDSYLEDCTLTDHMKSEIELWTMAGDALLR
jgi:hypothetical protein